MISSGNLFSDNFKENKVQKWPPRVVLRKRCSENMEQIYRRTPMLKCDFNKVPLRSPCAKGFDKLTFLILIRTTRACQGVRNGSFGKIVHAY